MTLRNEIEAMELRREQLLDEIDADVHQIRQQVRESVSPAALLKKHPIGAMAATVLAGVVFGRGAGRWASRAHASATASAAAPANEPADSVPKKPLGRLVDFAIRSGAVEMLAAVPWRDIPGMFRGMKHRNQEETSQPPSGPSDSAGR